MFLTRSNGQNLNVLCFGGAPTGCAYSDCVVMRIGGFFSLLDACKKVEPLL